MTPQPPRDYAAYALAARINNAVILATRDIEELRAAQDWRGIHYREDALREEILRACVEVNEMQARFIEHLRRELGEMLELARTPTIPLVELTAETWDQLRYPQSLRHYVARQREWSAKTFGPGQRTLGISAHIAKELDEIRAKPEDLSEWIDVMILAFDGYWRHGGTPSEIMEHLNAKQWKNFRREWPAPGPQDQPTEHIRSGMDHEALERGYLSGKLSTRVGFDFFEGSSPVAEADERTGLDSIGE